MPRKCTACDWRGTFANTVPVGADAPPLCPRCIAPTTRAVFDDHQIALKVNELVGIVTAFGHTQQLRERIAQAIVPVLKDLRDDR